MSWAGEHHTYILLLLFLHLHADCGCVICRQLSDNSAGLRTALDVVVQYEQRGAAMLTHLLGNTYSVQDLLAYALAAVGIAATGLSKSLRAASLPLIALFAFSVVAERAVMHSFNHMLELDPTGEVGRCAEPLRFQSLILTHILCHAMHPLDSCLGKVCMSMMLDVW